MIGARQLLQFDDPKRLVNERRVIQRHFIELERRWLNLARSYQLFERRQTFSAHQRGELSDRLEQLKLAQNRQ